MNKVVTLEDILRNTDRFDGAYDHSVHVDDDAIAARDHSYGQVLPFEAATVSKDISATNKTMAKRRRVCVSSDDEVVTDGASATSSESEAHVAGQQVHMGSACDVSGSEDEYLPGFGEDCDQGGKRQLSYGVPNSSSLTSIDMQSDQVWLYFDWYE